MALHDKVVHDAERIRSLFSRTAEPRKVQTEHYLSEAIVMDRAHVVARTDLSFSLIFRTAAGIEVMSAGGCRARSAVFGDDQEKIQAVIKISRPSPDLYLMVVRVVDAEGARTICRRRCETVNDYHELQGPARPSCRSSSSSCSC